MTPQTTIYRAKQLPNGDVVVMRMVPGSLPESFHHTTGEWHPSPEYLGAERTDHLSWRDVTPQQAAGYIRSMTGAPAAKRHAAIREILHAPRPGLG